MPSFSNDNNFLTFLRHIASLKEVACICAKDEKEAREFQDALLSDGFVRPQTITELLSAVSRTGKTFFSLSEIKDEKEMYDFIVQYPTGSVELWDAGTHKPTVASPAYHNSSVIFLVTEKELIFLREKGFEIFDKVGPIFRTT
jgi:hypothetical protein